MNEKYLILGASGNLGIRLTAYLVSQRKDVLGLVRNPHKVAAVEHLGAKAGLFDLDDPESLKPHLKGVTHLINTSYIYYSPNVLKSIGTHNTQLTSLKQVVFIGSTGVHTRLESRSAQRKREGEQAILASNIPYTIIRPTMIYGHSKDRNLSRLIWFFKRIPVFPVFGDGLYTMQPIYIDDVVKAIACVLELPELCGKIYDIGGATAMTYLDLLKKVANSMKKKIYFIHIPIWLAVIAVRCLGVLNLSPISIEQVLRLNENKHVNNRDARSDFGFNPIIFEEGLQLELHGL